jgi:four helix bundle protein
VSEIAEGYNRRKQEERIQHFENAKGSTARLSTQIILSGELQYITKEKSELLYAQALEVGKILSGLIKCMRTPQTK